MKRSLLFAVTVFLFSGILCGQQKKDLEITGKVLLDKMNSQKAGDNRWALGYVTGVFCISRKIDLIPDDATMKKVQNVAKKYLKANPNKLNQPANQLLEEAWKKKFPVEKK